MDDPFSLHRFVEAQQPVYDQVRRELAAGAKRSHWMWFIFPQIAGLGLSATSRHFAIASLEEARAYLAHPVLGARLAECTTLVNGVNGRSATQIFGTPDDMKFRSCMTLFARAAGSDSIYQAAIEKFFASGADTQTQSLIERKTGGLGG